MKTISSLFLLFFGLVGICAAQTVTIGIQVWMTKNLDVSTFRNGDPIPEAKTEEEWNKAGENKQPAWCYYDNDPANGQKYGKIYNWYAVNDPRGLAPKGWHIPSDEEWLMLENYLGPENYLKMKSTSGWEVAEYNGEEIDGNGNNISGFSGLPGGSRTIYGDFFHLGYHGYWWSSSDANDDDAWAHNLINAPLPAGNGGLSMGDGVSVRCIKDDPF
jgi:uncharacterized protein (TIGR02145 family)